MLFSKQDAEDFESLRKQYGDTYILDDMSRRNPAKKSILDQLRQSGLDDSAITTEFLKRKATWKIADTAFQKLSPNVQKDYQTRYNVEIVPTGKAKSPSEQPKPYETPIMEQARAEAEEQEPSGALLISEGKKVILEPYEKYVRQPIISKFKKEKVKGKQAVGAYPTALQIEGLVFNRQSIEVPKEQLYQYPIEFGNKQQNRLALIDLAKKRLVPTYEQMKEELGERRANSLIAEIQKQFPSGFVTKQTTAKQRGEIIGVSQNPVIDAVASTAIQLFEEELSDPNEWLFELLPIGVVLGLGKKTATGSVKVGKGMIKQIPDALKKDIAGIRKRIVDDIYAKYPRKKATQLVKEVVKISDNEIAEVIANDLLEGKSLDELVDFEATAKRQAKMPIEKKIPAKPEVGLEDVLSETARRDAMQGAITTPDAGMPFDQFSTTMKGQGYADDAIQRAYSDYASRAVQNNEPIHADAMKEMIDAGLDIPEGYVERNGIWRYEPQATKAITQPIPEPQAQITPEPSPQAELDLTGKAQTPTEAPALTPEPTRIMSVEDAVASSPSGKILDTPILHAQAQEGDVLKFGDGTIAQISGIDEDANWQLRRLKATDLPVEPTKAEVPVSITEGQAVVPETQVGAEMPAQKQAWEMTRDEWDNLRKQPASSNKYEKNSKADIILFEQYEDLKPLDEIAGDIARDKWAKNNFEGNYLDESYHEAIVKQALSEGKPVPAEVLKEYPDIAKYGAAITPEGKTVSPAPTQIEDVEALRRMGQERTAEIKALQEEEERIANENVQRTFNLIQEEEPKGLSIRKVGQPSAGKLPKESPITNKDIVETLATGQQTLWERATKDLRKKLRMGMDVLKAEMDPKLKQELRDYPEAYQFYDNVRTQLNVIDARSMQEVDKRFYGIWGDLNTRQRKYFRNLLGLRSYLSRVKEGEIPRDLTEEQVLQAIDELTAALNKSNAGKKIFGRVQEFRTLTHNLAKQLVAQGDLKPEVLARYDDPNYMYIEFTPKEYFHNYLTRHKKGQEPFRPYTMKAKGTTRDVVLDEQAVRLSIAQIFRDDMLEEFVDNNTPVFDIFWNEKYGLSYTMTEDELRKVFGESMMPQPNSKYEINGKWYTGLQKKRGNEKYLLEAITSDKKLEEVIHDLYISGYPDLPDEEVMARIAEIKKTILAIGRKNQTYLVPTPIADKMNRLYDPVSRVAGINELRQMNRYWKTAVLRWAGIPFQAGNAFGDNFNLYMFDAPALKYVFHKSPQKIINYYRNPLKYGTNYLTPLEKEAFDIAVDKDVFTSGFSAEWASMLSKARPKMEAKTFGRWLFEQTPWEERFNLRRESTTRLAEVLMQLERYHKRGKVHGGIFAKDIANLDIPSQIAYTARNIPIDYLGTPDWYRRNIPGIIQPFATWYHKNRANYARLMTDKWGLPKTLLKAGLPIAALYLYNTRGIPGVKETEQNGYIYDRLGYFQRRSGTIILKGIDSDKDGLPEEAWIMSPQLPFDSAVQSLGFEKMLPTLHKVDRKEITAKEAIEEIATNVLPDAIHQEVRLMAPFVAVVGGIMTNKDVVTGRDIIPEYLVKGMPEEQKAIYWANYLLEKTVSPYAQYIRQEGAGEETGIKALAKRGPVDIKRALGLYKVNLVMNENKEIMQLMSEKQAQKAYYINSAAQKYIEDGIDGVTKVLADAKEAGIIIPRDDLLRKLKSFATYKKSMIEKMNNADSEEERQRLKANLNDIMLNMSIKEALRDENMVEPLKKRASDIREYRSTEEPEESQEAPIQPIGYSNR